MRAVRELAMGHAGDRGLLLHAAAGAVAHRVVVLAGPTAAGKTTLLLHLLRSGVARYVAYDRVRVSLGEDPPRARGMPTIVTIRPRTRELFPDLAERLHQRAYQFRRGPREPVAGPCAAKAATTTVPIVFVGVADLLCRSRTPLPLRPWRDGRVGLSPAQLADALDVARVAEGAIAAVVFPAITGTEEGLSLHQLSPTEATDRLATSLLGSGPRQQRSELFHPPGARPAPDPETLRARCQRLALAVPCLECRLGEGAYADAGSATTLLALAR
jgi:hypothetical protein